MPAYVWAILILATIGICNTVYLSIHSITKTPVLCLFFPEEWCHTVQYSTYSKTLGIPNGMAGLGMYSLIFIMALMHNAGALSFAPIAYVIGFGFLFSMYFVYIQGFVLKAFCTWCVLSAIDFTLLGAAAIWLR